MVKEWPKENPRRTMVRISRPAGEWDEVNLNDLLACCRRELSLRQYVFPKRVAAGKMTQEKADKELELMHQLCEFLTHCIFKAVTRPAPPASS